MKLSVLFAAGFVLVESIRAAAPSAASSPGAVAGGAAVGLPSTNLHNLFRISTNILSGSAPENDEAFAELARLGVKTVISVDGSKPDIDAARRHGLRYVHLPFGYDGVPTNRVAELAKAATSRLGPIYVHCHHGLHRGPVAVAVICQADGRWTPDQALAWLRRAGTSTDYAGLYRTVAEFRTPTSEQLARVTELPEVAATSSLVDTMVAIDSEFSRLKTAQQNGWSGIPEHPDLAPAHTATILWEQLRELARSDDTIGRPDDYRQKLAACEQAAADLRTSLGDKQSDLAAASAAFNSLSKACVTCHRQYRN